MLSRRNVFKGALVAGMALTVGGRSAFAQRDEPIVIKFSHVVSADTPKGKAALHFKKLAEERTGGKVQVNVYANSQLYKDKEELEALQLGAVHMLAPTFSKFGPLGVREFEVFDLPYLFTDMNEAKKITQGTIGRELLEKLGSKGVLGLTFWDNAFKHMTANSPLRMPEDYKGLKIRIQSSKVIDQQIRQLGALPQVLAFSEVYQALQTGVVDGQENPSTNIYTQKFHEVQKHMSLTGHGYHGYVVIVNKSFWQHLPPQIRTELEGAMNDASAYFTTLAAEEEEQALAGIRASGKIDVHVPSGTELTALRNALLPVQQKTKERYGEEVLNKINRELGR